MDEEESERLDNKLEKILQARIDKRKEALGEGEEEPAEEEPEEGVPLTTEQVLINECHLPEEKELTKEMFKMINEKKEKEKK